MARKSAESSERMTAEVPHSPVGKTLRLDVISTWGDVHYLGLNGIEIFDDQGLRIGTQATMVRGGGITRMERDSLSQTTTITSITGYPEDINVLPEYANDPRHVSNLVDGVSFTRDDLHVWLAPVNMAPDSECMARVEVEFSSPVTLSMIRVWNYNKSRTYAQRGIRFCQIFLDDAVIFSGEIRIGPGSLSNAEAASEVILFTHDGATLQRIAKHDEVMVYFLEDSTDKWVQKLKEKREKKNRRPSTAERAISVESVSSSSPLVRPMTQAQQQVSSPLSQPSPVEEPSSVPVSIPEEGGDEEEPGVPSSEQDLEDEFMRELQALDTSQFSVGASPAREKKKQSPNVPSPYRMPATLTPERLQKLKARQTKLQQSTSPLSLSRVDTSLHQAFVCSGVQLVLHNTHGSPDYIGLGGVSFHLEGGHTLALDPGQVSADPRDMSVIGHVGDARTPDKLVNGRNDTTVDSSMWLAPFTAGGRHTVTFNFGRDVALVAVRIWNFNKVTGDSTKSAVISDESLLRGASVASMELITGSSRSPQRLGHLLLRRAPGCDLVSYPQTIYLEDVGEGFWSPSPRLLQLRTRSYVSPRVNQDYETASVPTGMLWKFTFYENYDDGYYLGLDGIEMFDESGAQLAPLDKKIATISAVPRSLGDIGQEDDRVPESLFFPPSSSGLQKAPGEHRHRGWLAPLSRCLSSDERLQCFKRFSSHQQTAGLVYRDNVLFVMFHKPVSVSLIRLYNYAKTPSRGVKTFGVNVDGNDVYMGTLKSAENEKSVPNVGSSSAPPLRLGQSVLFSHDPKLVKSEKERVHYSGSSSQDVLCINERKVMVRSKTMYSNVSNAAAEGIISDLSRRPSTAAVAPK